MTFRAIRAGVEPQVVALDAETILLERGRPEGDGVYLIERFDVPAAEHEAFGADWAASLAALEGRRGYLGARLHRDGDALTSILRWSSPLMVHRAREQLGPEPALYQRTG